MTADRDAVVTDRLVRRYATGRRGRGRRTETVALDGVSLRVAASSVHGLLGPNGAGKTTLVKILSTILLPTSGTARVMGRDVVLEAALVRPLVGIVLGGDRGLYNRLTARQNLRYWASLYRIPPAHAARRADTLLNAVGLVERADERVETYSRGMKQRLHLARGLVGDPAVVFLDEPTSGLDPVGAREFREMVRGLRRAGRTVLLATHDMAEAEALCDEVTFMDHGDMLATARPGALRSRLQRFSIVEAAAVDADLGERLALIPGVGPVSRPGDGLIRVETESESACEAVLRCLVDAGVTSVRTSLPSLDDVYLHVVGDRGLLL